MKQTASLQQALVDKINSRTKPVGSLGKLEDIALKIGMIQQSLSPKLEHPTILVFAADHGIVDAGVSVSPKETTYQMVMNFVHGGAGINVFSRQHGIKLQIIDSGVDYDFPDNLPIVNAKVGYGTKNMLHEPAMTMEECERALETGRAMIRNEHKKGCNVVGFGEMGIGNTSPASLLLHAIAGIPLKECVGPGAGLDAEGVQRKLDILQTVAKRYSPQTPLEILTTFGGFEIAMICGAVLEAKQLGMVILADGFIATSAFVVAHAMEPGILQNTLFSHRSNEHGHAAMLDYLGADPILHLELRLGEGTGVALAYPIIQSALTFLNEMASFESAAIALPRYK